MAPSRLFFCSCAVARSAHALASFGCFSVLFSSEPTDEPPEERWKMSPKKLLSESPIPVEPEPTPKSTKLKAKTTARNTNTHLAWRRRRGKKSWSSQLSACLGFLAFALGLGATAAFAVGRRLRCCVPLATRCLLAGNGWFRRRSSPGCQSERPRKRQRQLDLRPDRTGFE